MTMERRDTNPEVRQHRIPDDEPQRKHRWKGAHATTDGIREKTMRTSIDELEAGSSTTRWSSPGGAEQGNPKNSSGYNN